MQADGRRGRAQRALPEEVNDAKQAGGCLLGTGEADPCPGTTRDLTSHLHMTSKTYLDL